MEYINKTREIRPDEIRLIEHILKLAGAELSAYPISKLVYEYEGGKMGSINFEGSTPENYAGDILAVEFQDKDGIRVVVPLTIDNSDTLLDLDFWKEDFTALMDYPSPSEVSILVD